MVNSSSERPADLFTERTPRVVAASKLHRAPQRRKTGTFLAEGWNAVDSAVKQGLVRDIFVTDDAAERFAPTLESARQRGHYVHRITAKAAELLSDTVTTPGIFAVCDSILQPLSEILDQVSDLQLVLVGVDTNDPGNAGTMIRLADALGAQAVVFTGRSVDPLNTKVVRASAGSIFHVPVCRETDIVGTLTALQSVDLQLLATTMDGEVLLDDAAALLRKPTAWLMGSEAHGLDADVAAAADHTVTIPIRGRAESLNLATATAICLYASATAQHHAAGPTNALT